MRGSDAGDFGRPAGAASGAELPLFGEPEERPFAKSMVAPSSMEILVASLIWKRKGRANPITIADLMAATKLSEREVKAVVFELRVTHRLPIGAWRGLPAGYFVMVDPVDYEVGLRAYRDQVVAGWRLLRALETPGRLREVWGQLRLEE